LCSSNIFISTTLYSLHETFLLSSPTKEVTQESSLPSNQLKSIR
jgi:hypothetical protein